MGVTKNYVSAAHTDRNVLHSVISWFIRDILYFPFVFLVFSLLSVLFQVHSVFVWSFPRDVADVGKFVFPGFSLFFQPWSGPCSFWIFPVEPLHGARPKSWALPIWVCPVCATVHSDDLCQEARSHKADRRYVGFCHVSGECGMSTGG